MKKLKTVLVVTLCSCFITAFCQNTAGVQPPASKTKKLKIGDAFFFGGFMSQNLPVAGSLTDFKKLNPQSAMLGENMNGYSNSQYKNDVGFSSNNPAGSVFGAGLGLNFKETEKSVAQLRCGIAVSGINITNRLFKEENIPYDTLTSSQTGQTIYQDSITTQQYGMQYTAKQLHLDLSLIYRIYPSARWSFYGGVGLEGGTSLMAYTDVSYSKSIAIEGSSTEYDGDYRSERLINKSVQEYAAYLPIGVDFRMGKKRELLKQMHLFMEFRPFVSNINIPELGNFSSTGVKNAFGIRVTI